MLETDFPVPQEYLIHPYIRDKVHVQYITVSPKFLWDNTLQTLQEKLLFNHEYYTHNIYQLWIYNMRRLFEGFHKCFIPQTILDYYSICTIL